jgi:hypothetical protein
MTTCVQKLDDSSVASCPLPWCLPSCEGALKRRFHLQDVHCAEFNKGIKRDRHSAAAGDCCAQHTGMHIVVVEALLIAIYLTEKKDVYIPIQPASLPEATSFSWGLPS